MELSDDQRSRLNELIADPVTHADTRTRAWIVLRRADGRTRGEIAREAGVSLPTVDRWVNRFARDGIDGLATRTSARPQVPEHVRDRVLEAARGAPPQSTGLTCWTTRALADHLRTAESIAVSHNYVANLVRAEGIRWTSPATASGPPGRRPALLEVAYEVVVVDGSPAQALRERQTEAIRDILRWLREHPD